MKQVIRTQHKLSAPAAPVWDLISRGDQVEAWLPIISASELTGPNQRQCRLQDGAPLEETILKSDVNRTFLYSIDRQESFPVKQAVGTIRVVERENQQSTLEWDLEFEITEEAHMEEFTQTVSQVYAASAAKLQELALQTAAV